MKKANWNRRRDYPWWYWVGIFVIWLMLGLCFLCRAEGQGAVYLLHQPADFGIGPRVDCFPFRVRDPGWQLPGFYTSLTYGDWGAYRENDLRHHIKFTTGVLIPLKPYRGWNYAVSLGVNYHHLGKEGVVPYWYNQQIYKKWSYEAGLAVKMQGFALCFGTDIPRWEPCVGFGVSF